MGARGEYGKTKTNGGAGLEGNRRPAEGEERNDTGEGVTSKLLIDA